MARSLKLLPLAFAAFIATAISPALGAPKINIALKGDAKGGSQSYGGNVKRIVDGNKKTDGNNDYAFHSSGGNDRWAQVKLGVTANQKFHSITTKYYNRAMCCEDDRMTGTQIWIVPDGAPSGMPSTSWKNANKKYLCGTIAHDYPNNDVGKAQRLAGEEFDCGSAVQELAKKKWSTLYVFLSGPKMVNFREIEVIAEFGDSLADLSNSIDTIEGQITELSSDFENSNTVLNNNVALGGKVDDGYSGRYPWGGKPENLVNGDLEKKYGYHFFKGGADNWIEIELLHTTYEPTIEVYNRADCCKDRINGATLWVSSTPMKGSKAGAMQCGGALTGSQDKYSVECPTQEGEDSEAKYVMIFGKNLNLREIKVLTSGTVGERIADVEQGLTRVISQSLGDMSVNLAAFGKVTDHDGDKNKYQWGGSAGQLVDGILESRFGYHYGSSTVNGWVEIELITEGNGITVEVYNRIDCCKDRINGAKVYISTSKMSGDTRNAKMCGDGPLAGAKDVYKLDCPADEPAKYVMIKGSNLNLREVKALMEGTVDTKIEEAKAGIMTIIGQEVVDLEKKNADQDAQIAKEDAAITELYTTLKANTDIQFKGTADDIIKNFDDTKGLIDNQAVAFDKKLNSASKTNADERKTLDDTLRGVIKKAETDLGTKITTLQGKQDKTTTDLQDAQNDIKALLNVVANLTLALKNANPSCFPGADGFVYEETVNNVRQFPVSRKRRAVGPCFPEAARSSASEGGTAMIGGVAAVIVIIVIVVVIVVQRRKGKADRSTNAKKQESPIAFENPLYSTDTKDTGKIAEAPEEEDDSHLYDDFDHDNGVGEDSYDDTEGDNLYDDFEGDADEYGDDDGGYMDVGTTDTGDYNDADIMEGEDGGDLYDDF